MDIGLILAALKTIFSLQGFVFIAGGVIIGIIAGIIPGLTSSVALGLLLPITFVLPKELAYPVLLGIYCGATYGGAIPAILMNLPGTPTSAITALDGHPMTKQGRGASALGIAVVGSSLGGLFSAVILIFLSLKLSRVAFLFAGPEYFALTFFAVAVVVALTSKSVIKGIMAAGLGLLISTIGLDPVAPSPRFTFGITEILIGIPEVPATIGLFCTAEAFRLAGQGNLTGTIQRMSADLFGTLKQLPKKWFLVLRSAVIGTFIGILPGTGATMASFFAYGEAKSRSQHPELFGNGAEDGVWASEAANNAVTGGALVPMLTLGIPGDVNTMILLGAMFVHGLVPGPTLFRDELPLVYIIFGSMILANLLILVFGLIASKYFAKLALIDLKYLIPVILVLSISGPAMGAGHIYYFWIAFIFGILGYLLERGGFPVIATAMTLMLGPILESNLRRGLMLSGGSYTVFFTRPISCGLIVLGVLALIFGFRHEAAQRRKEQEREAGGGVPA